MVRNLTVFFVLVSFASWSFAQEASDLVVSSDETKVLPAGQYDYHSVSIANRGKLVFQGGVTIATEKFSAADGATIEYRGTPKTQENISISTFDASGLKFLYINANGKPGKDQTGTGPLGGNGDNAHGPGYSMRYPGGKASGAGGAGGAGKDGEDGSPAANVSLHLPLLTVGSTLRIHANGGAGGAGQQGGPGGSGGGGATNHPASDGGPGGPGGRGGSGGNAGKISVYLVVADAATNADKQEALKTLRLEYSNSSGTPGAGGEAGLGGPGGGGALLGGSGTRGSSGSLGRGGGQGAIGEGAALHPDQNWVITDVLTQSQYAQLYAQTLMKIKAATNPN